MKEGEEPRKKKNKKKFDFFFTFVTVRVGFSVRIFWGPFFYNHYIFI